jgi:Tfp pilus assembly protein PilF
MTGQQLFRINKLKEFLEKDPQDSFSKYALALEYIKLNDVETGKNLFEELVRDAPNYTGTYYQLGKLYQTLGRPDHAEKIFRTGIKITTDLQQQHAKSELMNALNELLYGDEI